jgi:hypothetical protein
MPEMLCQPSCASASGAPRTTRSRRLVNGPWQGGEAMVEAVPNFLRHDFMGEMVDLTDGDDFTELARLGELELPP